MGLLLLPLVVVLFLALAVTLGLRGTRFAWLPGLLLFAGAVATLWEAIARHCACWQPGLKRAWHAWR